MRASLSAIAFAFLAACGSDDGDTDTEEDCDAGFERHADGNCYAEVGAEDSEDTGTPPEPGGDPLEELFDTLPPCKSTTGDGELDFVNLCAGPLCTDMTYAELQTADAEEPDCDFVDDDEMACTWGLLDLQVWFWDDNGDEVIEPDQFPTGMYVDPGFQGTTGGGLGTGVSASCFLDDLGNPDSLTLFDYGGELWIYYWIWDYQIYAIDSYDEVGYGGDGIVDSIWMNGPG